MSQPALTSGSAAANEQRSQGTYGIEWKNRGASHVNETRQCSKAAMPLKR